MDAKILKICWINISDIKLIDLYSTTGMAERENSTRRLRVLHVV